MDKRLEVRPCMNCGMPINGLVRFLTSEGKVRHRILNKRFCDEKCSRHYKKHKERLDSVGDKSSD